MYKYLKSPVATKIAFVGLLVGIFILMFKLNSLTGFVVDDYLKYAAAVKIHSVGDMYQALEKYYLTWSGRVWGEFFSLLFLSMPKSIFNVANSFIYVVLLLLVYAHIIKAKYWSLSILIYINFSIWVFLPAFGQNILWLTGAGNYLWTIIIPLIFMLFYRLYDGNRETFRNYFLYILLFILGIFSGWANENFSVGIIGFILCYMWQYKKKYNLIPQFSIWGLLGTLAGSAAMWFAPGNFIRYEAEGHQGAFLKVIGRIPQNALRLIDYEKTLFLVLIFVILYFLLKKTDKQSSLIYLVGTFLCAIAMSAVGGFGSRIVFSGTILFIIATGILIADFIRNEAYVGFNKTALIATLSVIMLASFGREYRSAVDSTIDYNRQVAVNEQIIQTAISRGEKDIYVNPVQVMNRYSAAHGLEDLKPKSQNDFWLNKGMAAYYKVRTIQTNGIEVK